MNERKKREIYESVMRVVSKEVKRTLLSSDHSISESCGCGSHCTCGSNGACKTHGGCGSHCKCGSHKCDGSHMCSCRHDSNEGRYPHIKMTRYLMENAQEFQIDQRLCKGSLYADLEAAMTERQVEDAYNRQIQRFFKSKIKYPENCDGYVHEDFTVTTKDGKQEAKSITMIMEFKYDKALKVARDKAAILLQVIYYLYKLNWKGYTPPNVCLIGDKNECFVCATDRLMEYTEMDLDWDIAPSMAANDPSNAEVMRELIDDIKNGGIRTSSTFDVNEKFQFCDVDQMIYNIACTRGNQHIQINEHNILRIFDMFKTQVVIEKKISAHDLASAFVGVMTDKMQYYIHPNKQTTLVTPFGNITINQRAFNEFFNTYSHDYSIKEKAVFRSITDRLIDDTERRNSGDFFTPTEFVDYAHEMISKEFGADWRQKYVVWDNCCGTLNLTRDYRFKELYCSTLFESELNVGSKNNPEAIKFQFDFLNDYIPMPDELVKGDTKLPDGLIEAFE